MSTLYMKELKKKYYKRTKNVVFHHAISYVSWMIIAIASNKPLYLGATDGAYHRAAFIWGPNAYSRSRAN